LRLDPGIIFGLGTHGPGRPSPGNSTGAPRKFSMCSDMTSIVDKPTARMVPIISTRPIPLKVKLADCTPRSTPSIVESTRVVRWPSSALSRRGNAPAQTVLARRLSISFRRFSIRLRSINSPCIACEYCGVGPRRYLDPTRNPALPAIMSPLTCTDYVRRISQR